MLKKFYLCCLLTSVAVNCKAQEKRVAIVFGISRYQNATQLPNCRNDADSIANVLGKLSFDVHKYIDLSLRAMSDTIDSWSSGI